MREKLKSPDFSSDAKYAEMKKLAGGECSRCKEMPTEIISHDVYGAHLIEKYCDKCFKNGQLRKKETYGVIPEPTSYPRCQKKVKDPYIKRDLRKGNTVEIIVDY